MHPTYVKYKDFISTFSAECYRQSVWHMGWCWWWDEWQRVFKAAPGLSDQAAMLGWAVWQGGESPSLQPLSTMLHCPNTSLPPPPLLILNPSHTAPGRIRGGRKREPPTLSAVLCNWLVVEMNETVLLNGHKAALLRACKGCVTWWKFPSPFYFDQLLTQKPCS